jgi:hypothetical protein
MNATVAEVDARGGIRAIAILASHYYFYVANGPSVLTRKSFCIQADRAMGHAKEPVALSSWKDQLCHFGMGLTANQLRRSFEGGTVLHWPPVSQRRAIAHRRHHPIVQDRDTSAFMRSYPNLIPLGPRDPPIVETIEPFVRTIYGGVEGECSRRCKSRVVRSAERYVCWISCKPMDPKATRGRVRTPKACAK